LDSTFYNLLFEQALVAAQLLQIFFRIAFLEEAFINFYYALNIHYNNNIEIMIVILMEDSNGHTNDFFFFRNLLTVLARALTGVRQPWSSLTAGMTDLP